MKYPDDFDTPTFPAGKQIAVSRTVSIVIMVVFLLIMLACGALLWVQKNIRVHPFLVSVNDITGQWEVVGHQHTDVKEMTTVRALQESVIGKFLEYRFFVTDNEQFNMTIWQTCDRRKHCDPEQDNELMGDEPCALYCLSGDDEHTYFSNNIAPQYQQIFNKGETWHLDTQSVEMIPISAITSAGGFWQIRATINSNTQGAIKILAYVNVSRNNTLYPQTLGYYVDKFNAYRID